MTMNINDARSLRYRIRQIDPDDLNISLERHPNKPMLLFRDDYQVTFQDPTKPFATGFKRIRIHSPCIFHVTGVRSTNKNSHIFLLEPSDSVKKQLRHYSKGPGLSKPFEIAEITLDAMNPERMMAVESLRDILQVYKTWENDRSARVTFDTEIAGTW